VIAGRPPEERRRRGAGRDPAMVNKSMRVGPVRRTSVRLEAEFWSYLAELAAERGVRLSALVNEVAAAKPRGSTVASGLRVFALEEARRRQRQEEEQEQPRPEGLGEVA
jgi:predicted DNA-binding ribbon-helix-helix protein